VVSVTVCVDVSVTLGDDAPTTEDEIAEIPTNAQLDSTVTSATTTAELLNFISTSPCTAANPEGQRSLSGCSSTRFVRVPKGWFTLKAFRESATTCYLDFR
jgi:hypothetical protein